MTMLRRTQLTGQPRRTDGGLSASWFDQTDFERVSPKTRPPIGGVVLAAGEGKRYDGQYKLLETVSGESMIRRAVRPFLESTLAGVVVVVGHREGAVRDQLTDLDVVVVTNEDYAEGQSTSVHCGVRQARDRDWTATVFGLGDMPFVDSATLDLLVEGYLEGMGTIVAPAHDGARGNPTLFGENQYAGLEGVTGDTGGRPVLKESSDLAIVETDDPGVLQDVDVPEDL